MTKTDDRFEDFKEVIGSIDKRVKTLEDKMSDTREDVLKSESKLKDLITEAVSKGNENIMAKLEEQDKRIIALENAEAKKALEEKKDKKKFTRDVVVAGIVSVTIGWVVLGFLNNFASIVTQAIAEKKEMNIYEIDRSNK